MKSLIGAIAAFFFALGVHATPTPILKADFKSNTNGWKVVAKKSLKAGPNLGTYDVENFTSKPFVSLIDAKVEGLPAFAIDSSVQLIGRQGAQGYGIMFGAKDEDNGFVFGINGHHLFELSRIVK